MVKKIVNKALKKSNARNFLPSFVNAEKVINEIAEHFSLAQWSLKRIVLPLAIFYILTGFIFNEHVLGSLFFALIVFLYANFLPDLDAFFSRKHRSAAKATALQKRLALFFTPVIIYYFLSKKMEPFDFGEEKPFHKKKAMIEFTVFLFALGLILYFSPLKAFFLALFGLIGYATHLIVDKQIKVL